MRNLFIALLAIVPLLTGCLDEEVVDESNPEQVAVAFFDALYNKRDVKAAAALCSPQLARIVIHYQRPEAVARHLFNMQFDSVEIKPDSSGVKVREQFKNEAKITLYFEGLHNEDKIKDVKRLHMLQVNGDWVVNKVLKDPF